MTARGAETELAIVGAGPAGMAAAVVAAEHGASVTVIDEQPAAGGQYLRQPPREFGVRNWLGGPTYEAGKTLLERAESLTNVSWHLRTSVAGLLRREMPDRGFEVILDRYPIGDQDSLTTLEAETVLLAPGCFDMPVMFPGWNLPGVMAGGGIQAFIKSQQFVPGNRFLFVGSHPLQLIIADQILQAGGEVAGVLFSQSRARALALLAHPGVMLANRDKLWQTAEIIGRLKKAGVPVEFSQTLVSANGAEKLESVTVAPVARDGTVRATQSKPIACDRLGVCFSFLASSELARMAGARSRWHASRGGLIAEASAEQCSSIDGLYVAGEITGVSGAEVAALEGEVAGYHIMASLGKLPPQRAQSLAGSVQRRLKKARGFADLLNRLAWPGQALLDSLMKASVTLCKCEEVTVGDVETMLTANPHIRTANAAKLLSRTGMGLCQGRYCHAALTRLIARHRGIPEDAVGEFTARFPSKPVGIDQLIELGRSQDNMSTD
ncbi:MAG: FAD-dependent oxidoreductase [Pseudomonadota bacterium]